MGPTRVDEEIINFSMIVSISYAYEVEPHPLILSSRLAHSILILLFGAQELGRPKIEGIDLVSWGCIPLLIMAADSSQSVKSPKDVLSDSPALKKNESAYHVEQAETSAAVGIEGGDGKLTKEMVLAYIVSLSSPAS